MFEKCTNLRARAIHTINKNRDPSYAHTTLIIIVSHLSHCSLHWIAVVFVRKLQAICSCTHMWCFICCLRVSKSVLERRYRFIGIVRASVLNFPRHCLALISVASHSEEMHSLGSWRRGCLVTSTAQKFSDVLRWRRREWLPESSSHSSSGGHAEDGLVSGWIPESSPCCQGTCCVNCESKHWCHG